MCADVKIERMADNAKLKVDQIAEGETPPQYDVDDELRIVPTRAQPNYEYKKEGAGYKYYLTIAQNFDDWWFDFSTRLDKKDGSLKYKTLAQFILSKQKRRFKRQWLRQMIGPKPAPLKGQRGRIYEVPYLGDWAKIRKGNQKVINRAQIAFLRNQVSVYKEMRGRAESTAMIAIREIARCSEYQLRVDAAFAGQVLVLNQSPVSKMNRMRVELYFRWQAKILGRKTEAAKMYFRTLGLSPEGNWNIGDARPIRNWI